MSSRCPARLPSTLRCDNNSTDDTFVASISADAASSDFDFGDVVAGSAADGNEEDIVVIDVNTNGLDNSVALGGGTFQNFLGNTAGSIVINDNVTLTGTFDNSSGGTISITGANTLTVDDGGTHTNNAGTGTGIIGTGTVDFTGGQGDSHTVNAAGNLPNVIANRPLTLEDNTGGDPISINGNLAADDNVTINNNNAGASVSGNVTVAGSQPLDTGTNPFQVGGNFTTAGATTFGGTTSIQGTLSVTGGSVDATTAGTTVLSTSLTGGSLDVSGQTLTVNQNFTRDGGAFVTDQAGRNPHLL